MIIETVSTIGAGDNFNAGFIYALIHYGIESAAALEVFRPPRSVAPTFTKYQ